MHWKLREPLAYQRPVHAWMKGRDRIALFPEMRLGKTVMTIRWACERVHTQALKLVVGPAATHFAWADELSYAGIPYCILQGSSTEKRLQFAAAHAMGVRWFIMTPDGLRAAPDFCDHPWALVVLDESTFIANPKNVITKLLRKRLFNVRFKAILTGTPAPEHDLQYFEQLCWLNGSFCGFKSFWEFRAKRWHQCGYEWFPDRGVREKMEAELADYCYVLNAKDAGIQDRRIYTRREAELPKMLKGLYRRISQEFAIGDLMTKWLPVAQTWLAQVAGGCLPPEFRDGVDKAYIPHKFQLLEELMAGEMSGKPVVVFFRFNRELHLAAERLRKLKIKVAGFTGLNTMPQRRQVVEDFQAGRTQMLLLQGRAARFSLTLHRASAAIFFSNWWDLQTRQQLEARIRHPLKKEPAFYVDLVTKGTVDEAVVKALREKARSSLALLARIRALHEGFSV